MAEIAAFDRYLSQARLDTRKAWLKKGKVAEPENRQTCESIRITRIMNYQSIDALRRPAQWSNGSATASMVKNLIRSGLRRLGFEIRRLAPPGNGLYRPLYSPWESDAFSPYFSIAAPRTLVSRDRCYVLERLLRQTLPIAGEVFECGVYKGGTAALLRALLEESKSTKKLYLFDTFGGMPDTNPDKDLHRRGDFSDTSIEEVRAFVAGANICIFKKGFIPDTFAGLSDIAVSFCHIDVDIYKSIIDALDFVWPRLSSGGIIVFDDYGFPRCPGAREAVDDFFRDKDAVPLCLHTGQAIVFKK